MSTATEESRGHCSSRQRGSRPGPGGPALVGTGRIAARLWGLMVAAPPFEADRVGRKGGGCQRLGSTPMAAGFGPISCGICRTTQTNA